MSQENENYRAAETEVLNADEQNVARLLLGLKRVDAPKDFDFHLKARIANASPAVLRPVRFFPVLKYGVPLALFLLIGSAFVLMNSYSGADVPAVAVIPVTSAPQVTAETRKEITPPVRTDPEVKPQENEKILVATEPKNAKREFRAEQAKELLAPRVIPRATVNFNGGGSYDSAVNKASDTIAAPVLTNTNSNSNVAPAIPLQFRQMLMSIGIDAAEAGAKTWRVMKLAKDSVAERSGMLVGDVIEAIDGKPIDPLYKGTFTARSINVRRSEKVVKIDLQTTKP